MPAQQSFLARCVVHRQAKEMLVLAHLAEGLS